MTNTLRSSIGCLVRGDQIEGLRFSDFPNHHQTVNHQNCNQTEPRFARFGRFGCGFGARQRCEAARSGCGETGSEEDEGRQCGCSEGTPRRPTAAVRVLERWLRCGSERRGETAWGVEGVE
ncbi:hypothetical protein Scep_030177 [Stephania cephalantha]|uniref:Uncharacterized protein n=1 Tax=Stephania cephalantha TaxID=152367 RepID=A0AAP0DZA6_9MAGN